jgi:monovalent cation:proton antiporter-2 (CPA2) family protein
MDAHGLFVQAFVYLAAAVVSVPIARRLGLGSVLGYLIAGVAIGPFGLGLVGREGAGVLHFAEFGVVLMLFLIGLELSPAELWRLRGALLGLGGLQVLGTAAVLGVVFGASLHLGWRAAVAVGLVLSLSSTAIVLQSLREKGLLRSDAGERSFAVLLFQDLAVIPMLVVLPLLATGTGGPALPAAGGAASWLAGLPGWERTAVTLGVIAAIVGIGRFGMRPVFRFVARRGARETFTATALGLVVGIALAMEAVGLSPALGTFLGGMVLAASEYRHELEGDIEPFKGLLLGLFFLAVGASIDFSTVAARAGTIAGLVAGLVVLKFAVLFALGRGARMGTGQDLLVALALAQGGEFAFVLLSFAAQNRVLEPATANLLVAAVALSMAATPVLLLFYERVVAPRVGARERPARAPDVVDLGNPVILAGFGAFGSIAGRFLVANGVGTTILDTDSDHVELLRRFGIRVFYGDASREELLRAAGADRARVLLVATGSLESTRAVIRTARQHFPHLRVLARAKTRVDAYEVLEAGAHQVYRGSLDTSLRSGADVLRALGLPAHHAHRAAQWFRRRDEADWRALADVRRDAAVFQTRARESNELLERLLREQFHGGARADDAAWDSAPLRAEFGAGGTGEAPAPPGGPGAPEPAPS